MNGAAAFLRYTTIAFMVSLGLVGAFVSIVLVLEHPSAGGMAYVGLALATLIVLSVLAARRPAVAAPVFVAVTAAVVLYTVLEAVLDVFVSDLGPFGPGLVFVLAVALSFLALQRTLLAGVLILVAGVGQVAAQTISLAETSLREGFGPLLGEAIGSSFTLPPVLLAGLLFLVSAGLEHHTATQVRGAKARAAH